MARRSNTCQYCLALPPRRASSGQFLQVRAPHTPLRTYYGEEHDRGTWVCGLFNRTARNYDRLESIVGLGTGSWYRRRVLQEAGLEAGMQVLDVGTGTGQLARAAARIVGDPAHVTGVDPSPGMLENAQVPAGVRLLSGSAEKLPVADSCADFLCMGYALRHIGDLSAASAEFFRALRPGGRLCVLEITSPAGRVPRVLLKAWLRGVVPRIAAAIAGSGDAPLLMRYYWDTIAACVPPQSILRTIAEAGFVDTEHQVDLGIFSAYRARKP